MVGKIKFSPPFFCVYLVTNKLFTNALCGELVLTLSPVVKPTARLREASTAIDSPRDTESTPNPPIANDLIALTMCSACVRISLDLKIVSPTLDWISVPTGEASTKVPIALAN